MLTRSELLEPLARRRTNEVVVTTMSVVRPWGLLSHHPLDFVSADSAMAHAADLALGIALAQPARKVICLNGDGSMRQSAGAGRGCAALGGHGQGGGLAELPSFRRRHRLRGGA